MPLSNAITMWTSKRRAAQVFNAADYGTLLGWYRADPQDLLSKTARQLTASNSEYFTSSSASSLNVGTGDFTCGFWFYADSLTTDHYLMGTGVGNNGWRVYVNASGQMRFRVNDGTGAAVRVMCSGLTTATWYSIIMNWDRDGNVTTYVNNDAGTTALISDKAGTWTPDSRTNFDVGTYDAIAGTYFDGRVKSPFMAPGALFNSALRSEYHNSGQSVNYADVSNDFKTALGGGSFWNFAEVTGNSIDQHGTVDFTATNTPTLAAGPGDATPSDLDSVRAWIDKSVAGNDWSQASVALNPIYRSEIVNARGVVRFDGVDDYLSNSIALGTTNSVYIVTTASGGSSDYIYGANSGDPFLRTQFGPDDFDWLNGSDNPSISTTSSGFHLIGLRQTDASSLKIDFDGTEVVNITPATGLNAATFDRLAARLTGSGAASIDIAELIHYSDNLSDDNHGQVQSALQSRYGI